MENKPFSSKSLVRNRKKIKDKEILSALGLGLFVFIFISLVSSLFALMPPPITISRIITVLAISLFIAIGRVWNKLMPESWRAQFIVFFGLSSLLLVWAIHYLSYGVIGINKLIWLVPLVGAYIIAWILPLIDPSLAKVLDNEQFAPRTKLGRGCLSVALSVGGAAGVIGALIGRFLFEESGFQPVLLLMGLIISIVTVALSQTFAYQIFTKRLREIRVKQSPEQS